MREINNVSDVFREAKTRLWNGEGCVSWSTDHAYICDAIEAVTALSERRLELRAKRIIQSRLGSSIYGMPHTVITYLAEVVEVPQAFLYANKRKVQQYRKDWLTALEKEFAPKLKPKKRFVIHHIDGDKNNNELSNLTYVPLVTKNYS
jgi:K+ transporter